MSNDGGVRPSLRLIAECSHRRLWPVGGLALVLVLAIAAFTSAGPDDAALGAHGQCTSDFVLGFAGLPAGTILGEQYAARGVHISAEANRGFPDALIVFDTNAPPTHDPDLAVDIGNIAVLAKDLTDDNGDGLVDDPDENNFGGKAIFTFDQPVHIGSLVFVDHDHQQSDFIAAYNASGDLITRVLIPVAGNGSVQSVSINADGVSRLELVYKDSGGFTGIEVECPPPVETPTPTAGQGLTPTPAATPTTSSTPTPVPTQTPAATPAETPRTTETPTPVGPATQTPSETETPAPAGTPAETPSGGESTPTATATPTAISLETPTETPTETPAEAATPTATPSPAATPVESPTAPAETPTPPPLDIATPTATAAAAASPTAIAVAGATASPTAIAVEATPSASPVAIAAPTPTPTPSPAVLGLAQGPSALPSTGNGWVPDDSPAGLILLLGVLFAAFGGAIALSAFRSRS